MQECGPYQYDNRRTARFVPVVTWLLLAANIGAYLYLEWKGSTNDGSFMARHGTLIVSRVLEGREYYRLFTAFFLHFGLRHLFYNMLLLWYLGSRLERYLGSPAYALVYLLSGLGGNVVSLFYYAATEPNVSCAGASGAVFGIVGAMLWVVLRHRGRLADLTLRQLALMILFTLYSGYTDVGINNTAHIAGLFIGLLTGILFYRGGEPIRRHGAVDG